MSTPTGSRSPQPAGRPPLHRAGLGTTITALTAGLRDALTEILHGLLTVRRLRSAARVVKRKMSNYGVKRPEHRHGPRPTLSPHDAVHVLVPPFN